MMTIWKFPLEIVDKQKITIPQTSRFLTAQIQYGCIILWVLLDPRDKPEKHWIHIYGTGHTIDNMDVECYIATVQRDSFVWHVFDGGVVK